MAAAPTTLKELYTADLRDLCSANDQMQKVVQQFSDKATDPKLKQLFERSVSGIAQHTQALRAMVDANSDSPCPQGFRTKNSVAPVCLRRWDVVLDPS